MEWNELKSIWKKANDQLGPEGRVNETVVQSMIKRRSNTIISRILRLMRLKMWLTSIIGGLVLLMAGWLGVMTDWDEVSTIYGLTMTHGQLIVILLISVVLILSIFIISRSNYKKIRKYQQSTLPLKSNLEAIHKIMKVHVHHTALPDAVMIPVVFLFFLWNRLFGEDGFAWDLKVIIILAFLLSSPFWSYRFSKWLQMRKYGEYIEDLKNCIVELEEDSWIGKPN